MLNHERFPLTTNSRVQVAQSRRLSTTATSESAAKSSPGGLGYPLNAPHTFGIVALRPRVFETRAHNFLNWGGLPANVRKYSLEL